MTTKRARRPRHGAIWARRLVEHLEARGITRQALIGNSGINLSGIDGDDPQLPFDTIAALFERAASLTGDDLLGLNEGLARDFRESGLIAYLGIASRTVADMLASLAQFSRVFSEAVEIDVSALENTGRMTWGFTVPSDVTRRQYIEFGAVGTITDLRQLTGVNLAPASVSFRHNRLHHRSEIEKFFGCTVTFGAEANAMTFKPATLELPLNSADAQLFRVLSQMAEESLESREKLSSSLVFQVEDAIARRLSQGAAQVETIARDLGMSPRTLSRKLEQEGKSFTQVLAGFREQSARDYLTHSDIAILQIAFLLGYSDGSTFTTAFRRWTGKSPAEYRKATPLD